MTLTPEQLAQLHEEHLDDKAAEAARDAETPDDEDEMSCRDWIEAHGWEWK